MHVSDRIVEAVRIAKTSSIRPAAEAFRDAAMNIAGLRVAVTHNIAVHEPMKDSEGGVLAREVFGWGEAGTQWWQAAHLALTSPLPMACRFEGEPFWCNKEGFRTRTPNLLLAGMDLSEFEARAMARAAIVVPVHLPFGQIGAASFLHPDALAEDLSEPFAQHVEALSVLTRVFIHSYVKVTERRRPSVASVVLSKREVECLHWAAAGKTNEEIGMIIGLERTTIRFHIRSASNKLGAVNRDQTVFKAAQLGFLAMLR